MPPYGGARLGFTVASISYWAKLSSGALTNKTMRKAKHTHKVQVQLVASEEDAEYKVMDRRRANKDDKETTYN